MALVPSTMLELGSRAADFSLPEPATGRSVALADFEGSRALLVAFLSNHCPFVKHIADRFAAVATDYEPRGVAIVGINANDVANYPDDSPQRMKDEVRRRGYTFPYLFDESQEVAKAYRAACTPDFFLFDADLRLVYRGQFDSSRPSSGVTVSGDDLCAAIDAVLAGREPAGDQVPSVGCNIKWKAGNEPAWYG